MFVIIGLGSLTAIFVGLFYQNSLDAEMASSLVIGGAVLGSLNVLIKFLSWFKFSASTESLKNSFSHEYFLTSLITHWGKYALVVFVAIVGFVIYDSKLRFADISATKKPIKSIEEINSLCYVYWDGRRWQAGKTEGEKFQRHVLARYGVEMIEAALPIEMAKEFGINGKSKSEVALAFDTGAFGTFMNENWHQLDSLCKLR